MRTRRSHRRRATLRHLVHRAALHVVPVVVPLCLNLCLPINTHDDDGKQANPNPCQLVNASFQCVPIPRCVRTVTELSRCRI